MSTLAVGGSRLRPLPLYRIQTGDPLYTGVGAGLGFTLTFDVSNYINGRIRGNVHQNVAGTLDVFYGNNATVMDLDFDVPQDLLQPDFQYPFDIIVIQPFLRFTFVNGGAPSSLLSAYITALPV
jgi:hypothetical protein